LPAQARRSGGPASEAPFKNLSLLLVPNCTEAASECHMTVICRILRAPSHLT
jgi:hypothetical protein